MAIGMRSLTAAIRGSVAARRRDEAARRALTVAVLERKAGAAEACRAAWKEAESRRLLWATEVLTGQKAQAAAAGDREWRDELHRRQLAALDADGLIAAAKAKVSEQREQERMDAAAAAIIRGSKRR